jgi:type II secretory pathway pseudopilin PulG
VQTPALLPDLASIVVVLVEVVVAISIVAIVVGVIVRRIRMPGRRALHSFAEATATGRLELAEEAAARVLSQNDR